MALGGSEVPLASVHVQLNPSQFGDTHWNPTGVGATAMYAAVPRKPVRHNVTFNDVADRV